MRAAALALLLLATPALAQPSDAPVCLTRAQLALVDAVLAEQHANEARLTAENATLRTETHRIAEESSPVVPALVALAVGVVLGGGAVWALSR